MIRMKTRRRHRNQKQKQKRGGTRKIRFSNNTKGSNNGNNYSYANSKYLSNLYDALHKVVPIPSYMQEQDAQVLSEIISLYDDPKDMFFALKRIYLPEELTEDEVSLINHRLTPGKRFHHLINEIDASNLPFELKQKVLRILRFNRAVTKIEKIFIKNSSMPRYIHKEWNRTNTSGNSAT